MAFDLRAIAILIVAAPAYGLLPVRWRGWLLLGGSVLAIYWLQPPLPIRFSDYVLPTATLILTVTTWWFTRAPDQTRLTRDDAGSIGLITAMALALTLFRFVEAEYRLTPSRPPDPLAVMVALAITAAIITGLAAMTRRLNQQRVLTIYVLVIVAIFVVLKTPALAALVSGAWRGATGQDVSLASAADLNWLGFSYVAFRLIHTLRDRQAGILPALSLREYVTYAIFFASYTAGPIDRAERFAPDYRALPARPRFEAGRWLDGGTRIALGLLKKFVIADALAQGLALNATNAAQAQSTIGLWVLLYGYAMRLYLDFSGYTDIAIGLGLLFGIRLPENFNRPYLKTNLTAFWQSWHMTLSNWARFYVFTPLSRGLLKLKRRPSATLIVLLAQLATMLTIGLWHGVALNFAAWGAWHGLGLFVHKQWSDRTRKWYRGLNQFPRRRRVWQLVGWLATFQYVVVGWVWFALPMEQAARVMLKLFGAAID